MKSLKLYTLLFITAIQSVKAKDGDPLTLTGENAFSVNNNVQLAATNISTAWYSAAVSNIKHIEEQFYQQNDKSVPVAGQSVLAALGLNKTPEWTTSADGVITGLTSAQVNSALYGYSVTGLGDVNGDGFGDAAISAPALANIFAGNGSLASVGAVFVFYGSATGLSTTPAKTLQPNKAVVNALFGYSVAAGDVDGDGINDIIIGAPLDSYKTSASAALINQTTVTVTAGKVYVYPGGNSAAANPSNFIEIKLQGTGFFSTGISGLLGSNVSVNALFGFSVAATNDLDGDSKADIIVGSPAYLGTDLLSVQNGAAFIFYSNDLTTTTPVQLQTPAASLLGLVSYPSLTGSGLLFGFSVDGVGDYNNDGYFDVVVGAPAGIDLSSLAGVFTGQVLLSVNAVSLFGFSVAGAPYTRGATSTPRILVGAPSAALDFDNSLLNLGSTLGLLFNFALDDNGPGKAFMFDPRLCITNAPLPVTLLDFKGQELNRDINLVWKTNNESDLSHYEVEKSRDGEHFETAAIVFPWEGDNHPDYTWSDKQAAPGITYYRLKMIDKNGAYAYSPVLRFSVTEKLISKIVVAPNLITNQIRIQFNDVSNNSYKIELRNLAGQLFAEKAVRIARYGQTEYMMRTATMAPGVYFLTFFEKNSKKKTAYKVIVL